MTYAKTLLLAFAAAGLAAPLYAADTNSETNAETRAEVSATTPVTGVNVGSHALGKNTVKSGNSKGAASARGYDSTGVHDDNEHGVHTGANANPGVKVGHDHD